MTLQPAQLRIRSKIPHVETVTRSYGMMVRDAMLARLQTVNFFQGFTFTRSHAIKLVGEKMPYCNVYFMGEQLGPDGHANHGEVRFQSELHIGISVVMVNNNLDVMEDRLDNAYQVVMNRLLRDPTMYKNEDFQIESFSKGGRVHIYGQAGNQTNETPYAELRLDLYCSLGAIEYEPRVEYMLDTIHVETVHPPGDENNQHVYSVYDMQTGG